MAIASEAVKPCAAKQPASAPSGGTRISPVQVTTDRYRVSRDAGGIAATGKYPRGTRRQRPYLGRAGSL